MGRRLNKVLEVDEHAATCLLQPGVTFIGLYDELKKRGLGDKLWIDVPDLGGGSVIGNTLDRGIGYTRAFSFLLPLDTVLIQQMLAYGDHWAQHSSLEVVLPNGEVVRTGMDAMPGSNTYASASRPCRGLPTRKSLTLCFSTAARASNTDSGPTTTEFSPNRTLALCVSACIPSSLRES